MSFDKIMVRESRVGPAGLRVVSTIRRIRDQLFPFLPKPDIVCGCKQTSQGKKSRDYADWIYRSSGADNNSVVEYNSFEFVLLVKLFESDVCQCKVLLEFVI